MKQIKRIALALVIAVTVFITNWSSARAGDGEPWVDASVPPSGLPYFEDYAADNVCFANVYENIMNGSYDLVPVIGTFETFPMGTDILNAGTTSMTLAPCIPVECPDGMVLVSGNVCAYNDPVLGEPVKVSGFVHNTDVAVHVSLRSTSITVVQ